MSQRRSVGLPAVLFVDEWGWDCFFQLAAVIRREGFRTIRVSIRTPGRVASQLGLLFDRTVVLASAAELPDLPEILRGETVVDVQAVEGLAVAAYSAVSCMTTRLLAESLISRAQAVDKVAAGEAISACGICAPITIGVTSSSAGAAAELLALPIVYKRRVGSGGQGVHIVHTRDELEAIVAGEEQPDDAYFEQFIGGKSLHVGVFVATDRVSIGAAYTTIVQRAEEGPSSAVATVEHPELFRLAQDVVDALQLRGFVSLDVIEDTHGRLWVHDVNPRVWGSFAVFAEAGSDFAAAYVSWLCGEPSSVEPRWAVPGIRAWVFPDEISGSLVASPRPVAFRRLLRSLRTYGNRLGWRYVAFVVLSRRAEMLRVLTARRR